MPNTAGSTLADAPTGANQSVQLGELREIAEIRARAQRGPVWRWAFRLLRFEEAIILGLFVLFLVTYALLPQAPSLDSLQRSAMYHFYGNGTFAKFVTWCAAGTAVLLAVSFLPLAGKGRANKLMHGVWGEAQTIGGRTKMTALWGLGGMRAFVPFLACMGVYELNKRLIPAIRGELTYDIPLAQLEFWLFGDTASALVYKFFQQQWITDLVSIFGLTQWDIHSTCYISYVYAAPALAMALWFLGRRTQFNRFMGALVICSALAYIGYVLVPVVGPKWVFADRWLIGTSDGISVMDALKGRNRDCFPSLHTAWTVLFLIAAWKGVRPLFWVYLPIGIGVIISTLYGGEHYVLDLFAGAALAVFAWWVARPLRDWWDRRAGKVVAKPVAFPA